MARKKKQEVEEEMEQDVGDFLEQITPFVETLAPNIIEYQKVRAPIIKRWQWINLTIMMTILVSTAGLAYLKIIDGSAATGLIGAVIGYVFGGLYHQKTK